MRVGDKWSVVAVLLAVAILSGCSRSPHQRATRFIDKGKLLRAQKDYGRAILEFKNASQAEPTDGEPYYQIAITDLQAGDVRSGVANLRKATELNPKHVDAQLRLAELMSTARTKGILEEAERRLTQLLELPEGSSAAALTTLAVAEVNLGKLDLAEQHLKDALAKFPDDLRPLASLAGMKLGRGDIKAAEALLKSAVDKAPKSAEAKVALAALYTRLNRLADAEAQLSAALTVDPRHAVALYSLASLQEHAGRRDEAERTLRTLSALPDPRYKPLHAIYLQQIGQQDAALQEFERLYQENRDDRAARSRLIAAYISAGRTADAEKTITAALKVNRKDVDALLQRSQIYLTARRYNEAQRDLEQILRFRPESGEVHYYLAKIHSARGAALQARQELGQALRLTPKLLPARIEMARQLMAAGSPKAAIETLNEASVGQQSSLDLIITRNWALRAIGNLVAFRKGIQEGLAIERSPDLLLQDGVAKAQEGSFTTAEASFQEGVRRWPDDVRFIAAIAQVYSSQKQSGKGLNVIRQFAVAHPKSGAAQHLLADWLMRNGDRSAARGAFASAKAADPGNGTADLALAQLDIEDGALDAARQRLSTLLTWNPDDLRAQTSGLSAHVLLGNVETMAGNYKQAIEHYRKVIDVNDTNVMALNNLAYLLAEYGKQPDEALKYAQRAKEKDPQSPNVADTIGWVLYQKGLYDAAIPHLEAAAATNLPQMKYHLAMAYMKAGDSNRGEQVLKAALRQAPNLPEAAIAKAVLDQARDRKP